MKINEYKYDGWDLIYGECGYHDTNENIYIDTHNRPITGFLENFWYFKEEDSRNWQYVENGKRSDKLRHSSVG